MSNILKNTKVYLAGNMEHTDDSVNWRNYMAYNLKEMDIKVLSPLDTMFINQNGETDADRCRLKRERQLENYEYVAEYMKGIVQKDLRLIDLSDYVIVNMEIKKPTFGTIHELVIAIQQKKPVFLAVGDKRDCPLWLLGIVNPKYIYNNIDEILSMIRKIDSGDREIDIKRWRLLLPEHR